MKDWGEGKLKEFKDAPIKTTLKNTWNVAKWFPPIAIARGSNKAVGWIGNKWYTEYKEQDSIKHKIRYVLDQTGDTLGIASGALYATGLGAPVALALDGIGALFDVGAAGMYAWDGDWKSAGIKLISVVPALGSGVAFARQGFKLGKPAVKLAQETKALAKLRETYAPFASNVYGKYSTMKVSGIPSGFKALSSRKLREMGFSSKSVKALTESKGIVYLNKKTNEIVTAFAGTRPPKITEPKRMGQFVKDMAINFLSAMGMKVGAYKNLDDLAISMKQISKNYKVMLTAHSKGNVPSSIVSGLTGFKAITFNPAGVNMNLAKNIGVLSEKAFDNVRYIIQKGDMLNDLQNRSVFLKYLMPSAKGTGYIIPNSKALLNQPTLTLSAYIGKLLGDGLKNHGLIKMLNK